MKNVLRRIVPILLAIAVVGCAVWYLFVYDRDFTRDMLVTQARYLDDAGYHEIAAWFYDQAYQHADNDASVAIELAQQYRDIGNYTKAEFTLSKAISKNPSVELYTSMCKLFVEQNKLIDAVALLDKVSDPTIKLKLDSMRPAAPVVNQTPGFYNQYITVELSCDNGTLLFTTDREYPSVTEDLYTGPISLGDGETTVYAMCVGENGLVSTMSVFGYTIGGVIEEVTFADAAIEAEVRKTLNVSDTDPVLSNALWTIESFTVPQQATVYSDLAKMTGLQKLTIYNANSNELGVLSSLPQLVELTVTGCSPDRQVMNAISAMTGLNRLTLAHCNLSDLAVLATLKDLTYLDLSYNFIQDLAPLSHLEKLETLYLSNNAITDLSPLSGLMGLEKLNVAHNSITSLIPVCSIRNLISLNVSNNLLENLGDLDLLPELQILDASYNLLDTVTVLGRCSALTKVDISNNDLEDIDALENINGLRELNCSYNELYELPEWSHESKLITLDASYNRLWDISSLANLQHLNVVNLDYNSEIKNIDVLGNCPMLVEVDLFGTGVTDVSVLTQQSIIVNYNPTEVNVDDPEDLE